MPGKNREVTDIADFVNALAPRRDGAMPIYLQLRHGLARLIREGRLRPEQSLPSERAVADALAVSRVTARKAIEALVEDGLVVRRHGRGNFVAPAMPESIPLAPEAIIESPAAADVACGVRWLRRSVGTASPQELVVLGLSPGARVTRLERLRLADGEVPIAFETSAIPASFLPDPAALRGSLHDYLARRGDAPVRALQHIRAVKASERQARLLGIAAGQALLCVTRVSYLEDGRAVETTDAWCRGDYYDFVFELRR